MRFGASDFRSTRLQRSHCGTVAQNEQPKETTSQSEVKPAMKTNLIPKEGVEKKPCCQTRSLEEREPRFLGGSESHVVGPTTWAPAAHIELGPLGTL